MTQRVQTDSNRTAFPRSRTFGTAAATGRQQLAWIWTRESLLRLLLSFVLALALWLYISNKQNPAVARDFGQPLPVVVSDTPDGVALVSKTPNVVYVRIKQTDPNAIVTPSNFHVWVDLIGLGPGKHRVRIHVLADPGIQVVEQRPLYAGVSLERKLYQHVPTQANIVSRPPTGYGYQIHIDPSTVTASGPEDLVSQVSRATVDLGLAGIKTNQPTMYRVTPENSQGGLVPGRINLSPSQVHVTVKIRPFSSYKTLPVLAQIVGQPKTGFGVVSIVSHPAEVTLTGPPDKLSRISTVETRPVSVAHRGGGTFTVRTRLKLPGQTSTHTRTVKTTIKLAPVESSSTVKIAVISTGVANGLTVSIVPDRLLVTVAGSPSALRSAGRNVTAQLKLTGYGVGTVTLAPTVTAKGGVQVLSSYPRLVTVTLESAGSG